MKKALFVLIALFTFAALGMAQSADPCANRMATKKAVSQAATGPTTLVALSAGKQIYICSVFLLSATQQNFNLVEGTGTNCGTAVSAGLLGGVDAATGPNMQAGGWFNFGDGSRTVTQTTASGHLCIISSSTGQISGVIMYVQR